jgi:YD repeat-containing protein
MSIMNRHIIKFVVVVLLGVMLLPLTSHSTTIIYQYDRLNRLTSVLYDDVTRISYAYDPAGNRLSVTRMGEVLKGKINEDELVNLADAILGLQVLSGQKLSGIRSDFAASGTDVGGNKKIGMEEVIYILQKVGQVR